MEAELTAFFLFAGVASYAGCPLANLKLFRNEVGLFSHLPKIKISNTISRHCLPAPPRSGSAPNFPRRLLSSPLPAMRLPLNPGGLTPCVPLRMPARSLRRLVPCIAHFMLKIGCEKRFRQKCGCTISVPSLVPPKPSTVSG